MEKTTENLLWAVDQVSRMEVLPGYPKTETGVAEMAKFLLSIAGDKEAGERTIDTAVAEEDRFPPPVYLKEILERLGYWPANRPPVPGMPGYKAPEE